MAEQTFREKLEERLIPHYETCPFLGDGQDCERAFMAGAAAALELAAEEFGNESMAHQTIPIGQVHDELRTIAREITLSENEKEI